jgi:hypothetical protein
MDPNSIVASAKLVRETIGHTFSIFLPINLETTSVGALMTLFEKPDYILYNIDGFTACWIQSEKSLQVIVALNET